MLFTVAEGTPTAAATEQRQPAANGSSGASSGGGGGGAEEEEQQEEDEFLELPEAQHSRTVPDFLPAAPQLRAHFDARLGDPQTSTAAARFCWDWWHVSRADLILGLWRRAGIR